MFYEGQKVVCVFNGPWIEKYTEGHDYGPRKNKCYVVSGILQEWGQVGLQFDEYPYVNPSGKRMAFHSDGFRPLEDFPNFQLETVDERIEILSPQTEHG